MISTAPPGLIASAATEQNVGEELLYAVLIRSFVDAYTAASLASRAALTVGLDALGKGSVAIVAGELSTNIVRHAREGKLSFYGSSNYLKIVAEDHGPGIRDLAAAMTDGHSGGRFKGPDDPWREGIGCGLGAIRRLSDRVRIRSSPGAGTLIVAVRYKARILHA